MGEVPIWPVPRWWRLGPPGRREGRGAGTLLPSGGPAAGGPGTRRRWCQTRRCSAQTFFLFVYFMCICCPFMVFVLYITSDDAQHRPRGTGAGWRLTNGVRKNGVLLSLLIRIVISISILFIITDLSNIVHYSITILWKYLCVSLCLSVQQGCATNAQCGKMLRVIISTLKSDNAKTHTTYCGL